MRGSFNNYISLCYLFLKFCLTKNQNLKPFTRITGARIIRSREGLKDESTRILYCDLVVGTRNLLSRERDARAGILLSKDNTYVVCIISETPVGR